MILSMNKYMNKKVIVVFALLLVVDIIFLALHLLFKLNFLENQQFSVTIDRSYSEWFQYAKEATIIVICALLAKKHRSRIYVSWMLLFTYLLLDDSLRFHEKWGEKISDTLNFGQFLNLRAQDLGELFSYASIGSVLIALLVWAYFSTQDDDQIEFFQYMMALFIGLVFFGVGVDMVHSLLRDVDNVDALVGLIEDWGEMIMMSGIVAFCTGAATREDPAG